MSKENYMTQKTPTNIHVRRDLLRRKRDEQTKSDFWYVSSRWRQATAPIKGADMPKDGMPQDSFILRARSEVQRPANGTNGEEEGKGGNTDTSQLELVIRALLGDLMMRDMSGSRTRPVTAVEWVSWAVMYYMDLLFSYKVLDLVAQLRDVLPHARGDTAGTISQKSDRHAFDHEQQLLS